MQLKMLRGLRRLFGSTLAAALALALGASACGRSSPQVDFCRAREGLSCATLATERAAEQSEYAAAVALGDATLVEARGACVQDFVAEQIEDGCIIAEPSSLCAELCTLHPCAVRAVDGTPDASASCPARCVEERNDASISVAALQGTLERAAGTPGLCTCAVCDISSQSLCDELWVCD